MAHAPRREQPLSRGAAIACDPASAVCIVGKTGLTLLKRQQRDRGTELPIGPVRAAACRGPGLRVVALLSCDKGVTEPNYN